MAAVHALSGRVTAWNPSVDIFQDAPYFPEENAWVDAVVVAGSTVYIGGHFTRVGMARRHLAGVDTATGAVALNLVPMAR